MAGAGTVARGGPETLGRDALRTAQRRSRREAVLIVCPERPRVVPLTRAHLKSALASGEPVIVVRVGELSLPSGRAALELLARLPCILPVVTDPASAEPALVSERAALDAFAALTSAALHARDLQDVARQATDVLHRTHPELSVGFYQRREERWVGLVLSDNIAPEVAAVARAGLPLDLPVFAAAVRQPDMVFVDGWDPEEQQIPESAAYGAGAFAAYFQDDVPVAVLSIGSTAVRRWDEPTRLLLTAVSRSLDLARQRLEAEERRELERRELAAFATFTDEASRTETLDALVQQAFGTLGALFPGCSVAFYLREGDRWWVRHVAGAIPASVAAVLRGGVPECTPIFQQVQRTRQAAFTDRWDAAVDGIEAEGAQEFRTVMLYPVESRGDVCALLGLSLQHVPAWRPVDRAVAGAVGRSFSSLYERLAITQQERAQREVAEQRARALETFSALTGAFAVQQDPLLLIRQAQEAVLELLPGGHAAYWEPEGELWRLRVFTNEVGNKALQAMMEAGVPVGRTPTLDRPWSSGEALYQDDYAEGSDVPMELTGHVSAVVALPVLQGGQRRGVLNYTTFAPHRWTAADRAVLEGVTRNLTLALERSEAVQQLLRQTKDLQRLNSDLRAANEELEAFAYSASHDLRTPVRHVQGFVDLLEKSVEAPSERTRRYADIVRQSATRMNTLIDAMLLLSRAGRSELHLKPLSLEALVRQAQQDVLMEFPELTVEWRLGALPVVSGDQDTLQQVVTNLLSNAVKYSSRQTQPVVEVWAEVRAAQTEVHVRDNGVGFDPVYVAKLFGVFQRLHAEADFAGTGVGLATVRRIVQRHGGQVRAEGQPGAGATFSFTLPILDAGR